LDKLERSLGANLMVA